MMSARPRARGCTRFVDGPSSAYARETFSVSRSSSRLFSALATADFKTFSTARAARDDVNRRIASASFTGRPRIIRTTSWTFFAESRRYFASALASIPVSRYDPVDAGGGVAVVGAAAGVTPVVRSAAAVAAAVDGDGMPHHLRDNRGAPRPRLDHAPLPGPVELTDLFNQVLVYERPLLCRTAHASSFPPFHDKLVAELRLPRLCPERRLPPRADRPRHADGRAALAAAVRVAGRIHRHPANPGPDAQPALPSGLSQGHRVMLQVAHLADRRLAVHPDQPHFAGRQPHVRVLAFLGHHLRRRTGRPRHR